MIRLRLIAALALGLYLGAAATAFDRNCFAAVADDRSGLACELYVRVVMNP